MDTKKPFNPKSRFDPNRHMYIAPDCSLVYTREEKVGAKWTQVIVDRIPFTPEAAEYIIQADEDMHREELDDRYAEENADYGFQNKQAKQTKAGMSDSEDDFDADALESIQDPNADIFDRLFPEEETINPLIAQVDAFLEKATEKQRDLFYRHFGMMQQLEEIRAEDAAASGKAVSQQAVSDRKKKLIAACAKALGAEPPARKRK